MDPEIPLNMDTFIAIGLEVITNEVNGSREDKGHDTGLEARGKPSEETEKEGPME